MLNINMLLNNLSEKRPVFRSEKDFQDSLFQHLRELGIKSEKNKIVSGIKVDLWLESGDKEIFIQLKHKTKKLSVHVNGSQFELKNHGAQDQGRYDFIKDVKSLEPLCLNSPRRIGYAILLTNDHRYWERSLKLDSVDKEFHLHGGRKAQGNLSWKEEASPGTKKGRENSIEFKGVYDLQWSHYSKFVPENGEFRYLCVEV